MKSDRNTHYHLLVRIDGADWHCCRTSRGKPKKGHLLPMREFMTELAVKLLFGICSFQSLDFELRPAAADQASECYSWNRGSLVTVYSWSRVLQQGDRVARLYRIADKPATSFARVHDGWNGVVPDCE